MIKLGQQECKRTQIGKYKQDKHNTQVHARAWCTLRHKFREVPYWGEVLSSVIEPTEATEQGIIWIQDNLEKGNA